MVLLMAALSSVGAQQPDALYKFDDATRKQIQILIDSARLEGLPWNALRLVAVEGAAKKAKGRDVVQALRRYYKELEQARYALGPLATAEEIETGASVLRAGVNPEDLAKFRVVSEKRSPMRPLTYLADLISQHNVPRNDAIAEFTRLWKDGAADSDFDRLWSQVDQDILGGISPRQAFQQRVRAMPVRPPGEA
jgi:hypothetical protein